MDSPQHLKKRLKSVKNICKITKAMELVSATKMRKAQEVALMSRPYALVALDLLANLSLINEDLPELLKSRESIKKVLFVLVSSDKGLAGSFNSAVFRKFQQHLDRDKEKYKNEEKVFMAIGEKANQYLIGKGLTVSKQFIEAGDFAKPNEVHPITDFIISGYLEKKWDRAVIISNHFLSALKQETHVRLALPINFDSILEIVKEIIPKTGKFADLIKENDLKFTVNKKSADYLIEPSPEVVLENLAKHLFFIQMYQLILEANAAEHSARRMAMKTASDNASDLLEKINLEYNKVRQAGITNQIIEIVSGAEALN